MKKSNGFTLIELTIVIIIAGLLIGLFANFLTNYNTVIKQHKVQSDLELVSAALISYLKANGKLPCPASNLDALDSEDFGREVDIVCSNVNAGTPGIQFATSVNGNVVTGSVPVRAINIPDENIKDPWGMRYAYSVSAAQASNGTSYNMDDGAISIIDANGNSLIQPEDNGSYLILSYGANSVGGFTLSGAQPLACNISSSPDEQENCDGDTTFLNTLTNSEAPATFFDDLVVYQTGTFLAPQIPAGAVMPFVLATCPAGWSSYTPAVGRAIVGAGTRNDLASEPGTPTAVSFSDVTYTLSDSGGALHRFDSDPLQTAAQNLVRYENRNPYVALLYCIKN